MTLGSAVFKQSSYCSLGHLESPLPPSRPSPTSPGCLVLTSAGSSCLQSGSARVVRVLCTPSPASPHPGCCSGHFVLPVCLPLNARWTLPGRVPAQCREPELSWPGQGQSIGCVSLRDLHHCPTTSDHRPLVLTLPWGSRSLGLRLQPEGLLCHLALSWEEGAAMAIEGGDRAQFGS